MRIISRSEWGAKPWRRARPRVPMSARRYFVVHYHGGEVRQQVGNAVPRNIEAIHLANGWSGIGYNWAVDQDGVIYEGHGWDLQGAHSPPHNYDGIGVYFAIGGNQRPSDAALAAGRWLYDEMARKTGRTPIKWWHGKDYATACPGPHLIDWVKAGMPTSGKTPGAGAPTNDTRTDLERLLDSMDETKLGDLIYGKVAEAIDHSGNDFQAGSYAALRQQIDPDGTNEWEGSTANAAAWAAYHGRLIRAELAGLRAAIQALANAQGANPEVIGQAVEDAMKRALGSLEAEVKLTIEKGN